MLNKIDFNPNVLQQTLNKPNVPDGITPDLYPNYTMTSDVSNAYRAYGLAGVSKPLEKKPLSEYLLQLQKQNKVEGKDYTVSGARLGGLLLEINNKDGQVVKSLHFDETDENKCSDCIEYIRKNGEIIGDIWYDGNGRITSSTESFDNAKIPQESFTKQGITYKTTPQDYIEYLKKNNISYKVKNNRDYTCITQYDTNGKKTMSFSSFKGSDGCSIDFYDKNEALHKTINFSADETQIDTFFEKISTSTINRNDIPQENFTKEHITAETTPQEYINYLQKNNKMFKIKKENIDGGILTKITEFDRNNKDIQDTTFYTKDNHTTVSRHEFLPNYTWKEILFTENDTVLEKRYFDN